MKEKSRQNKDRYKQPAGERNRGNARAVSGAHEPRLNQGSDQSVNGSWPGKG